MTGHTNAGRLGWLLTLAVLLVACAGCVHIATAGAGVADLITQRLADVLP